MPPWLPVSPFAPLRIEKLNLCPLVKVTVIIFSPFDSDEVVVYSTFKILTP